eukprot:TRINITY_DN3942_c0_g2_i7.p1 TRINITY_DN3942_c0_g2~~TRINITY_DN3942_c0_g2_i7.p1  ORF type:complete len:341 (-),score=118.38 TRINITY_DN3942_c0_g2_i7:2-982(-)
MMTSSSSLSSSSSSSSFSSSSLSSSSSTSSTSSTSSSSSSVSLTTSSSSTSSSGSSFPSNNNDTTLPEPLPLQVRLNVSTITNLNITALDGRRLLTVVFPAFAIRNTSSSSPHGESPPTSIIMVRPVNSTLLEAAGSISYPTTNSEGGGGGGKNDGWRSKILSVIFDISVVGVDGGSSSSSSSSSSSNLDKNVTFIFDIDIATITHPLEYLCLGYIDEFDGSLWKCEDRSLVVLPAGGGVSCTTSHFTSFAIIVDPQAPPARLATATTDKDDAGNNLQLSTGAIVGIAVGGVVVAVVVVLGVLYISRRREERKRIHGGHDAELDDL